MQGLSLFYSPVDSTPQLCIDYYEPLPASLLTNKNNGN